VLYTGLWSETVSLRKLNMGKKRAVSPPVKQKFNTFSREGIGRISTRFRGGEDVFTPEKKKKSFWGRKETLAASFARESKCLF